MLPKSVGMVSPIASVFSCPLSCDDTNSKSMYSPFSFSMILGCLVAMRTLVASPLPLLLMMTANSPGTIGSTSSVSASSP